MALSTQPYKGTRDFYPEDFRIQRYIFETMRKAVQSYGYLEYDGPMLEPFELYAAKTGEEIVSQQLYCLTDHGDRKLAIRPEMTPTLARMVAARFHQLAKPIRLFSIPNLWRYERPQRGRLREHWQLNVDVLGGEPLYADAEILKLSASIIDAFGGLQHVVIRINNRKLIDHFFTDKLELNSETAHQISRLVDARAKIGEEKYCAGLRDTGLTEKQIDSMESFFKMDLTSVHKAFPCEGSRELTELFEILNSSPAKDRMLFDPLIFRGMEYYTGTVFEMYDESPENNRAMFGGGRYDNLVGLFGSHELSGVGLGLGDVTLKNFLETHQLLPGFDSDVDVMVGLPRPEFYSAAEQVADSLRSSGFRVMSSLSPGPFGTHLKQASKLKIPFVVLFGDEEWKTHQVLLKNLKTHQQLTCPLSQIAETLKQQYPSEV